MLSTVFLHMLPEVRDSIKKAVEKRLLSEKADEKYNLGELLICTRVPRWLLRLIQVTAGEDPEPHRNS